MNLQIKTTPKTARSPKDRPENQIWLLVGPDDFQLDTLAREQIAKILSPPEQTFGLETIDASTVTVTETADVLRKVIAALSTPYMFAERRLLWVRNASFLADSVMSRAKEVSLFTDRLAELVKNGLPAEQFLIITAGSVPAKSGFVNACAKHGTVVKQEAVKPWHQQSKAAGYAKQELARVGLTAASNVVEKLAAQAGFDSRQLHQEIFKLSVYLDNRTQVTLEDIDDIVIVSRDFFVWDLEDAIISGNLKQALEILRRLLFQKEEPIRIVNSLEIKFRALAILREAIDRGLISSESSRYAAAQDTPQELKAVFAEDRRLANPYTRGILLRQTVNYTARSLSRAQDHILNTRQLLVSGSTPPQFLMERLIILLCRLFKQK